MGRWVGQPKSDIRFSTPFSVAYIIPIPWVPTLLWYQDCLPYYDILKRYHNKAGKCAYLIMISGVPTLLWYPELIDLHSACFIMTSWVPMLLIYTECLPYYDICWKMANCAFLINISVVPTLLWHGECLPYYNLPSWSFEANLNLSNNLEMSKISCQLS